MRRIGIVLFASAFCVASFFNSEKVASVSAADNFVGQTMDIFDTEYANKEQAPKFNKNLSTDYKSIRIQGSSSNYSVGKAVDTKFADGSTNLGVVNVTGFGEFNNGVVKLGKNFTDQKPVSFDIQIFPDGGYPFAGEVIKDGCYRPLNVPSDDVNYGQFFILQKKGKLDFSYDSGTNKYSSLYLNETDFSNLSNSYSKYANFVEVFNTEYSGNRKIEFSPTGEDMMVGCNFIFVFLRQVKVSGSNYRELQMYHVYVGNDVPVAAFTAGKYPINSFDGISNANKSFYSSKSKQAPSKMDSRNNLVSYSNKSDMKYSNYISNSISVDGQLVSGTYNGEKCFVYKGSSNPTINASYIKISYNNKNNDSLQPVLYDSNLVDDQALPIPTRSGAYILEKSYDKKTWALVDYECNVVDSERSDKAFSFKTDQNDFTKGVYYRLTAEFTLKKYDKWKEGFLFFTHDEDETFYYTYLMSYEYFFIDYTLVPSTGTSFVHDYGSESSNIEASAENKALNQFFTLGDEAVSFSPISVDNLGYSSNEISYSYNGGTPQKLTFNSNVSESLTKEGCYDFSLTSPFGTTTSKRLYIMDIGTDNAYKKFFGDSFVDESKRIYTDKRNYPTYQVGSKIHINKIKNLPGIYGQLTRQCGLEYELIKEFKGQKDEFEYKLTGVGTYRADLYTNDISRSGQFIHYVINFYIEDWSEQYKPTVNEEILKTSNRVSNYRTKIYSYKIKSLGDGNFIYSFPFNSTGYSECVNFAVDYEYTNVVLEDDKYTYKGKEFENNLQGKIDLNNEIYKEIEGKINTQYIDPSDPILIEHTEDVADIKNTCLDCDMYVTNTENNRKSLLATDVFLNNFQFQQVSKYESESVQIQDLDGTLIDIKYNTPIENYLSKTGKYKIIEKNWCGTNEYYANFIADGEITAKLRFKMLFNNEMCCIDAAKENFGTIISKAVILESASDEFDSQALLEIKGTTVQKIYLLSEIDNLNFNTLGDSFYEVRIINRLGSSFTFTISILKSLDENKIDFETIERTPSNELIKIDYDKASHPLPSDLGEKEKYVPMAFYYAAGAGGGIALIGFVITIILKRRRVL